MTKSKRPTLSARDDGAVPHELEFKFSVPVERAAAISARLAASGAVSTALLHAHYFDTSDDRLAAAGLSLRLRLEGDRWVQTLKKEDQVGNLDRLEHEVDVTASAGSVPDIDLHRHEGTVPGRAAFEALGTRSAEEANRQLVKRFSMKLVREVVDVVQGASTIEIAFDVGHLDAANRSIPLSEIEFELKSGRAGDLRRVAQAWLTEGLHLEAESKPQRGLRLLHGQPIPPAVKAGTPMIAERMSPDAFVRRVVADCLAQILPNASVVAGGTPTDEHVHQLRIGIRRLRTALGELGGLSADLPRQMEGPLRDAFRALGVHRDRESVLADLKPKLEAAGAPSVEWMRDDEAVDTSDLSAAVRLPAFQGALLKAVCYAAAPPAGRQRKARRVRRTVEPRLKALHRQAAQNGRKFDALHEVEQHDVRKRLKRLRYLSEFVEPLYGSAPVHRYLDDLKPAQDALGEHNDGVVGRELAEDAARRDKSARFAVHWLSRESERTERRAHRKLRKVRSADKFWTAADVGKNVTVSVSAR